MNPNTRRAREAETYIDAAQANNGGLLLVVGTSGLGKTFFLKRLRETAYAAELGPIHVAAADENEQQTRYALIERLLGAGLDVPGLLSAQTKPDDIARLLIHRLVPPVSHRVRTILLDDMQWADPDSTQILRYIVPRLAGRGVFFVLASRPPVHEHTLMWHLQDEAPLHQNWRCIELLELSVVDVQDMALERFGTGISRKMAQRVHDLTGGSFAQVSGMFDELTQEEIQSLHLRTDFPARLQKGRDNPELVERYRALTPAGQFAVEIVTLAAAPVELSTVLRVADLLQLPIDTSEALEHDLVHEVDFGDSLVPGHPLLVDSADSDNSFIPMGRSREILGALASFTYGHRSLVFALRAATVLTPELREAVEQDVQDALAVNNVIFVNETIRRCLQITEGTEHDDFLIELLLHCFKHKMGFLVLDLITQVEALPSSPLRECLAILIRTYQLKDHDPIERVAALLALPDDSPDTKTIQAFVSFLVVIAQLRSRDTSAVSRLIAPALELWATAPESADELSDQRLAWMVAPREYELLLECFSLVPFSIEGQHDEISARLPGLVDRAMTLRPTPYKVDVLVALAGATMSLGRVPQAYALASEGFALLEGNPRPWSAGGIRIIYAHTLALRGRLNEALQLVKQFEQQAYEFLDVEVRLTLSALHAWLAALTGTEDPAPYQLGAQRLYNLHWEAYGIDLVLFAEVEAAFLSGQHAEVIALTEPHRYRTFTSTRHGFLTYRALSFIALNDFVSAELLIADLTRRNGADWYETYGTIDWLSAKLAFATQTDPRIANPAVEQAFERAISATELPLYRGRTIRDFVLYLRSTGQHAAADSWTIQAQQVFTTLDAAADLAELQAVNQAKPQTPDLPATSTPLDELTPRELEIASLIAEGHSTNHIAQTLVISPATVRFHVSNVLTKLALTSRGEIAKFFYGIQAG